MVVFVLFCKVRILVIIFRIVFRWVGMLVGFFIYGCFRVGGRGCFLLFRLLFGGVYSIGSLGMLLLLKNIVSNGRGE